MSILSQILSKDEICEVKHDYFDFSKRLFTSWDELKKKKIIIFGAGLYGYALSKILIEEKIPPLFFVDSDENLCGSTCNEIMIKPISILHDYTDAIVILSSAYAREMAKICRFYNITTILPIDLPPVAVPFAPIGYREKDLCDDIVKLYQILDEDSRFVLRGFLKFQLTLNLKYIHEIYSPHPYFSKDLLDKVNYDIFCDLGASTGDTFNEYINLTKIGKNGSYYYYAFEPDKSSFDALQKKALSFPNLKAIYGAVGRSSGSCQFMCDGMMSSGFWTTGAKMTTVPIYALDEYDFKKGIPTVIKADIEGFELNALQGARNIISKYKPDLIFSIYHKVEDLYKIPLYINELGLGYKIHIRQQSKSYGETIVYAIAEK